MLGLTSLGVLHTAIALVAVVAGSVELARRKEISWHTSAGRTYVLLTALTCLTGFGIFQHGGFGNPHVLGIITLVVLGVAWVAEMRPTFGRLSRYVSVVGYSTTFFFHMIPGFTETSTRLPPGRPLVAGPEAPELLMAVGVAFVAFLVGAVAQVLRIRSEPKPALVRATS
jgi:uncharacterized membrane protein